MMNGHAECFVKPIKRECLDKLIFLGEDSLQNAIDHYVAHYHHERPHQGLDNKVIEPDAKTSKNQGDGAKRRWANAQRLGRSPEPKMSQIQKIARLGGLLNHYYRDPLPDFENEETKAV